MSNAAFRAEYAGEDVVSRHVSLPETAQLGLARILRDGDYEAGFPDVLEPQAFSGLNGTGTLLGSTSVSYTAATFPSIAAAALALGNPFLSVRMIGETSAFPNSMCYDNITVAATPEPATLLLIRTGLLGVAQVRRRKAS